MDDLRIVIVGHVDHGKSTLIGRLLYDTGSLPDGKMEEVRQASEELGRGFEYAYILDNLREEREQGITIDTAQIFFRTERRNYIIIDAPGHVEFVKNMITGASQAEAAVLIVDAGEGMQEQTRRHAYILGLLGIKQVVVAVNKIDLVGYSRERFDEVKSTLSAFLATVGVEPEHVIPVSAKSGDNVTSRSQKTGWYTGPTVIEALDAFKPLPKPVEKPMRLPIQDVYVVDGRRIFAGRVESGVIRQGDEVTVLPDPRKTKVKSVESYLKTKIEAEAGESTGITTTDKLFIERGHVLCSGTLPKVSTSFNAKVFWMGKEPLKNGEKVTLKLATQETGCRLEIHKKINSSTLEAIGGETLGNNEAAEALVTTDAPIVYEDFHTTPELGRFVLQKDNDIVAGGIIT